jgi:hypothetical protein
MSKIGLLDVCVCRFCMMFVKNEDRSAHLSFHNISYVDKDYKQVFAYHPSARDWIPEMNAGKLWVKGKHKSTDFADIKSKFVKVLEKYGVKN